jgi:4'-phosphopantetheinyl transferase
VPLLQKSSAMRLLPTRLPRCNPGARQTGHTSDVIIRCCVTERLDRAAVAGAVRLLSTEERARHDRFLFASDRRDFAVAHALLRCALTAHGDRAPHEWTFATGPHGKPQLAGLTGAHSNLSFSLTHTRGLVACAMTAGGHVGIDVEAIDLAVDITLLARRCFSPDEISALESCDEAARPERFVEHWVLKEAYVKATGKGLSVRLDELTFAFNAPASIRFESPDRAESMRWRFALFAPTPLHRLAVAVRSSKPFTIDAAMLKLRDSLPPARARDTAGTGRRGI